jgi:F-type H+-transporting ATPase subunit b
VEDLIHQFGIDWKLLLAQVVNFFILFYVLKRFAYKPVIALLNERQRKIVEGIAASDESKKKLETAEVERMHILLKAEEESVGIVSRAEQKAEIQAKNMLDAASKKSEQVIASGQKKLEEERKKLADEVEQEAVMLIKKGLATTIGKMNPNERDEVLIKDALQALKTIQ